jgi:hypothetical protein
MDNFTASEILESSDGLKFNVVSTKSGSVHDNSSPYVSHLSLREQLDLNAKRIEAAKLEKAAYEKAFYQENEQEERFLAEEAHKAHQDLKYQAETEYSIKKQNKLNKPTAANNSIVKLEEYFTSDQIDKPHAAATPSPVAPVVIIKRKTPSNPVKSTENASEGKETEGKTAQQQITAKKQKTDEKDLKSANSSNNDSNSNKEAAKGSETASKDQAEESHDLSSLLGYDSD